MAKFVQYAAFLFVVLCSIEESFGCKSSDWYNMTMEQLLLKSDIVVLGKDLDHGKFRLPLYLDARFDVHCVLKTAEYLVPGQVIIEDINGGDACSGVKGQTKEGQDYIVGLKRELSGYMSYATVNPLQKTAFPATLQALDKVASFCGLDKWSPPETGDQTLCPTPRKPRFCTKIRYPKDLNTAAEREPKLVMLTFLVSLLINWIN